jgi:isoleucyl-tRNA synthetase
MYDFFTMYASVDGWEFEGDLKDPSNELQNPLDKWIVSRVHQLRNDVTENMDKYDLPRALEGVLPMVDDASNWFVRRSRRRFWKSENGADKLQAYKTLHYVLSYLALILAPFTPFLSEELWSKLIGGESVHLKDWPEAGVIDEEVLADMAEVRSQVNEALALRAKNSVKIRQPLASATVIKNGKTFDFTPILTEELNIKSVNYGGEETILDLNLTDDLKAEGTSREVIRHIQNSRKKAGLNVDDRIKLNLDFDDDFLAFSIDKFINEISKEVLAEDVKLNQHIEFSYSQSVKVDSQELKISLEKI